MNVHSASSVIGIALVLVYVVGSGLWVNTGDGCYLVYRFGADGSCGAAVSGVGRGGFDD